jgi:hypothetical protein
VLTVSETTGEASFAGIWSAAGIVRFCGSKSSGSILKTCVRDGVVGAAVVAALETESLGTVTGTASDRVKASAVTLSAGKAGGTADATLGAGLTVFVSGVI